MIVIVTVEFLVLLLTAAAVYLSFTYASGTGMTHITLGSYLWTVHGIGVLLGSGAGLFNGSRYTDNVVCFSILLLWPFLITIWCALVAGAFAIEKSIGQERRIQRGPSAMYVTLGYVVCVISSFTIFSFVK